MQGSRIQAELVDGRARAGLKPTPTKGDVGEVPPHIHPTMGPRSESGMTGSGSGVTVVQRSPPGEGKGLEKVSTGTASETLLYHSMDGSYGFRGRHGPYYKY